MSTLVAVLAVGAGLVLCLHGYGVLRSAIGFVGAGVGFVVGADLVATWTRTPFLHGVAGWAGALVGAVLLATLAYRSYQVAVVAVVGAVGYGLGVGLMTTFGGPTGWPTVAVGVLVGVLLAVVAVVGRLPALLLVGVTALAGAELIVVGVRTLLRMAGVHLGLGAGLWAVLVLLVAVLGGAFQVQRLPRADHT